MESRSGNIRKKSGSHGNHNRNYHAPTCTSWVTTFPKRTARVSVHDVSAIGQNYVLLLVIEVVIWNIGFRQTLDGVEYLLPVFPAIAYRAISRWHGSKPPAKEEADSLVGREEILKLIHRVDESYTKVEGFRGILLSMRVVGPIWPILALLLVFFFVVSGVSIPFPSNLILTTSLLALAISLLSISWNFVETQSERIGEAFEERMFDEVKQHYEEKDYALVRAVIRRRHKSGPVKLEAVYRMNPNLFTRKALAELLVE